MSQLIELPLREALPVGGASVRPRSATRSSFLRGRAVSVRADGLEDGHGATQRRAHGGSRRFARATKTREPLLVRRALRTTATASERARRSIGDLFVEEHTIPVGLAGVFQRGIARARRTGDARDRSRLGGGGGLTPRRIRRRGLQWPRGLRCRLTRREETDCHDGHGPDGAQGIPCERLHRVPTTLKSSIWRWNPAPETAPGKYNRPVSE